MRKIEVMLGLRLRARKLASKELLDDKRYSVLSHQELQDHVRRLKEEQLERSQEPQEKKARQVQAQQEERNQALHTLSSCCTRSSIRTQRSGAVNLWHHNRPRI